jgi:cytochrome c oxidase subunit 2
MLLAQTNQIVHLPEQASTFGPKVDPLFWYVNGVGIGITLLVFVVLTFLAIRYRRRSPDDPMPGPMHGNNTLEIAWTVIPLGIVLVMFAWGASVYMAIARPPQDALEIYVVGRQWMWKIQHPEGQREINTLHVPAGVPVRLIITSEDVVHSFGIPSFRTKQDAVPGRYSSSWFQATEPGTYYIFCNQYCGTEHSKMVGKVTVMEPSDYQKWLHENADGSMALEGRKLFSKLQCITCHGFSAQGRAPALEDLYGRYVNVTDGDKGPLRRVLVDDNYLRESILQPAAKVVVGWKPIMPSFEGQVTPEELNQVIAYIKSLKQGQTPGRVEDTPQPESLKPAQPESKGGQK